MRPADAGLMERQPEEAGVYGEEGLDDFVEDDLVTAFGDPGDPADIESPLKAKEPPVTREHMAKFLENFRHEREACSTIPYTIALWVLFLLMSWMHGEASSVHRITRCVEQALEEIPITIYNEAEEVPRTLTLREVSTANEMWSWLLERMVPTMSGSRGRPGYVCSFNQVVGDVMLRQHRVKPADCYLSDELFAFYGSECYSLAAGSDTSTATYGDPNLASRDGAWTAGSWLAGLTGDNPERFFAWLDCERDDAWNPPPAAAAIRDYWDEFWVDDQTASVEARVLLFNPEERAFGGNGAYIYVSVSFDFNRGGVTESKLEVAPQAISSFPSVLYVTDAFWYLLMLLVLINAIQGNKAYEGATSPRPRCGPWVVLEAVIVVAGCFMSAFFITYQIQLGALGDSLAALGERPDVPDGTAGGDAVSAAEAELNQYHSELAQLTGDVEALATLKACHRVSQFWYALVLLLRFFRGFDGQPRLAAFGRALLLAASDLLHVAIVLLVVYLNFVLGGCVLFGRQLSEWSGFGRAMQTTIDAFFGRGDFAAMYEVSPMAASMWLFFFVGTYSFVVINVIIAILVEHFAVATRGIEHGKTLPAQLYEIASDKLWTGAYMAKVLYGLLRERLPTKVQTRFVRQIDEGPQRVKKVPIEAMIQEARDPEHPASAGATPKLLMKAGCDPSTAERMYRKAVDWTKGYAPEAYPPAKLANEFRDGMREAYHQLDELEGWIREFLYDKALQVGNLEPRQEKLQAVQQTIQVAHEDDVMEFSVAYPSILGRSQTMSSPVSDIPRLKN